MSKFVVDDVVEVMARLWPGINKPGGVGRVKRVFLDEENEFRYDVNYIVNNGRENNVHERFVKLHIENSGPRNTAGRCKFCNSFITDCGHDQDQDNMEVDDVVEDKIEDLIEEAESDGTLSDDFSESLELTVDVPIKEGKNAYLSSNCASSSTILPVDHSTIVVIECNETDTNRIRNLHRKIFECCLDEDESGFIDNSANIYKEVGINESYNQLLKEIKELPTVETLLVLLDLAHKTVTNLDAQSNHLDNRRRALKKMCIDLQYSGGSKEKIADEIVGFNDALDECCRRIERAGFEIYRLGVHYINKKLKMIRDDAYRRSVKKKLLPYELDMTALGRKWMDYKHSCKGEIKSMYRRYEVCYGCSPDDVVEQVIFPPTPSLQPTTSSSKSSLYRTVSKVRDAAEEAGNRKRKGDFDDEDESDDESFNPDFIFGSVVNNRNKNINQGKRFTSNSNQKSMVPNSYDQIIATTNVYNREKTTITEEISDDESVDSVELAMYFEESHRTTLAKINASADDDYPIADSRSFKKPNRLQQNSRAKGKSRVHNNNRDFKEKHSKITIDSFTAQDELMYIAPPKKKEFSKLTQQVIKDVKDTTKTNIRQFNKKSVGNNLYHRILLPEDHSVSYHGRIVMLDNSTVYKQSTNFHLPYATSVVSSLSKRYDSMELSTELVEDEFNDMRILDKLLTSTSFFTKRADIQKRSGKFDAPAKKNNSPDVRPTATDSNVELEMGMFTAWEDIGKHWENLRKLFEDEYLKWISDSPKNTLFQSTKENCRRLTENEPNGRIDIIILNYFSKLWNRVNESDDTMNLKANQAVDRFTNMLILEMRLEITKLQKDLESLREYETNNLAVKDQLVFISLWDKEFKRISNESQGIVQWIYHLLFEKFLFKFLEPKKISSINFKSYVELILRICDKFEYSLCYLSVEQTTSRQKQSASCCCGILNYLTSQYFPNNQEYHADKYDFIYFSLVVEYYYAKVKWLTSAIENILSNSIACDKEENCKLLLPLYSQLVEINQQCFSWLTHSNRFLFGIGLCLIEKLNNSKSKFSFFSRLRQYQDKSWYRHVTSSDIYKLEYDSFWELLTVVALNVEDLKKPLLKFLGSENEELKLLLQLSYWEKINRILACTTNHATASVVYQLLHLRQPAKQQPERPSISQLPMFYSLVPHSINFTAPKINNINYSESIRNEFGGESLLAFITICTHVVLMIGVSDLKLNANSSFVTRTPSSFRVINNWHALKAYLSNQLAPVCSLSPTELHEMLSGKLLRESMYTSTVPTKKSIESVGQVQESINGWLKSLSRVSQFTGVWDQLTDKPSGAALHILWNMIVFCSSAPTLPSPSSSTDIVANNSKLFPSIWVWLEEQELEQEFEEQQKKHAIKKTVDDEDFGEQLKNERELRNKSKEEKTTSWICPVDYHSLFLFTFDAHAQFHDHLLQLDLRGETSKSPWLSSRHQLHTKLLYVVSMLFTSTKIINPWEKYLTDLCASPIETKEVVSSRSSVLNALRTIYQQLLYHLFSSHCSNDKSISVINYKRFKGMIPDQLQQILSMFETKPCLENGLLLGMFYKELMYWYGRESFPVGSWKEVFNKLLMWSSDEHGIDRESAEKFEQARSCLIMFFAVIVFNPLPIATTVIPVDEQTTTYSYSLESIPSTMSEQDYLQYNLLFQKNSTQDDASLEPLYEVLHLINLMYESAWDGTYDSISDSVRKLLFAAVMISATLITHHSSRSDYPSTSKNVSVNTSFISVSAPLCIPWVLPRLFASHLSILKSLQGIANTALPNLNGGKSIYQANFSATNFEELFGSIIYLVRVCDDVIFSMISEIFYPSMYLLSLSEDSENFQNMIQYLASHVRVAEEYWQHIATIHLTKWMSFLHIQSKKTCDTTKEFMFSFKKLSNITKLRDEKDWAVRMNQFHLFYSSTKIGTQVTKPLRHEIENANEMKCNELRTSLTIQIIHEYASLIYQCLLMDEVVYPSMHSELILTLHNLNNQGNNNTFSVRKCNISWQKILQEFYSFCGQISQLFPVNSSSFQNPQMQYDYGYLSNFYQIIFWQHIFTKCQPQDRKYLKALVSLPLVNSVAGKSLIIDELLWCVLSTVWIEPIKESLLNDLEYHDFLSNFNSVAAFFVQECIETMSATNTTISSNLPLTLLQQWLSMPLSERGVKFIENFVFSFLREFMTSHNTLYITSGQDRAVTNQWRGLLGMVIDQFVMRMFRAMRYVHLCSFHANNTGPYSLVIKRTEFDGMNLFLQFITYLLLAANNPISMNIPNGICSLISLSIPIMQYFNEFVTALIQSILKGLYDFNGIVNINSNHWNTLWTHFLQSLPLSMVMISQIPYATRSREWEVLLQPLLYCFFPSATEKYASLLLPRKEEVMKQWIAGLNSFTLLPLQSTAASTSIWSQCCSRQQNVEETFRKYTGSPLISTAEYKSLQDLQVHLFLSSDRVWLDAMTRLQDQLSSWQAENEPSPLHSGRMKMLNKQAIVKEIQAYFQKCRRECE